MARSWPAVARSLVAVTLIALLAVAGCDDPGSTDPAALNDGVVVIGDSNIFNSTTAIQERITDAGFETIVHGYPGYGLKDFDRYWRATLRELMRADPAMVVVALGTNDTVQTADLVQVPVGIDQVMGAVGDREVIWITVANVRPGANPPTAGATVNAHLLAAARKWDNLSFLDWAAVIDADPSVLAADGLHWSTKGRKRYAESIRDAVLAVYERCDGVVVAGCG
jgi:lysophospholipase L1-like esterase